MIEQNEIFDNLDLEELELFKMYNLSNRSMSIVKNVLEKCDYHELVRILTNNKNKKG